MTASKFIQKTFKDITHLIYPNLCLSCDYELTNSESGICSICRESISFTNYQNYTEVQAMEQLFWGRLKIQNTYAHFYFEKHRVTQKILFNLKYKNNGQIGQYFGQEIGEVLAQKHLWKSTDAIIPVPLHPHKQFCRGYNQSYALAKGIESKLRVPVVTNLIKRNTNTVSQTKKGRFSRWDNVNNKFIVHPKISNYKHVIIVDDVITTGSTIEAIINAIHSKNDQILISVVTLAIA